MFKSNYSTITHLGMLNQQYAITPLNYSNYLQTTINSKRNVFASRVPSEQPKLRYFGIGINGFYNVDDGHLAQPYIPNSQNMDLYLPIPFRIIPRDEEQSLTALERAKYRMRSLEVINGEQYIAYWLKAIEWVDHAVQMTKITPDGDVSAFTLDPANLNPTPVKLSDDSDEVGNQIVASVTGRCLITNAEIVEAVNTLSALAELNILHAKISELGCYTGIDAVVQSEIDGLTYTEAIYAQLAFHRCSLGVDMSIPGASLDEKITFENGSLGLL